MASICGVNLRAAFGPPGGTYQHTIGVYKPPWQPSIFAELNLRFPVAQKALFTEFCNQLMAELNAKEPYAHAAGGVTLVYANAAN